MHSSRARWTFLWLTIWICLATWRGAPTFGLEIDGDLGEAGAPSLGIYQVTYLATAVNLDPNLTRGYQAIVDLQFKRAIAPLQACIDANRQSDVRMASEAATFLGYSYVNLRQPPQAVAALNLALQLNPNNPLAHFFLAQEYFIENQRPQVREHLELAIKLRPDFLPALRMLAETAKEEGRGGDAIDLYTQIVKYLPNSGYYRYQQYQACIQAARYDMAETAIKELMRIEPAFVINHYRLGEVYINLGRYEEARREYATLDSTPEFQYLEHLGYAKVAEKEGDLTIALQHAQIANKLSSGTNSDAKDELDKIQLKLREQTLARVRQASLWGGVVLLLVLLIFSARAAGRRKFLLAEIHTLNDELGRIHDQDELCVFLLDFFCPLLDCEKGLVLLHNRFSNQLVATSSRNVSDADLPQTKIVTASDVVGWSEGERRFLLRTADLGAEFEKQFPSLQERLQKAGIQYLLLLRERDYFLGFVGVGNPRAASGRVRGYDLLGPLLRSAAKSMEAVILYETSMVDETTGLYNKRYFKQALGTEIRRADRYQQPCTLITFDLDDFKKINDTYGHGQGDLVLKGIGDILRRNSREGIDTVARTGGEEFHLILPATSADRALILAERVRSSIEEHRFDGFSKPVKVTVSLGLATYPSHAIDDQTLLKVCDEAQYKAKRLGKNRVVVADSKPGSEKPADRPHVPMVESRIDNLNIVDVPTGLFNFTYFSLRLREELRRSGRYPTPVSLLVLHLDGNHDDATAVSLLKQIGVLIRESLRDGIDTPTRLETGELAIIVPETTPEAVGKLAARLMEIVSTTVFQAINHTLSVSIGISGFPTLASQENELLEAAVQAARKIAEMGGNGIVIAPAVGAASDHKTRGEAARRPSSVN